MNARQRVKICGISDAVTARVAVDAGADFIGVVFYPGSHRYVEPKRAREISDVVHADGDTNVVGLFVNEPLDLVLRVHEESDLDVIQLSGNESGEYMDALASRDIPFLATLRAGQEHRDLTERHFQESLDHEPYAVHFDTHVPGMWGGSGVVGDWELAGELARCYRLFLAGGLDQANVADAVREVRPFAVDVSSGVETNKIKDHKKIRAFIEAARSVEGSES